jgi:Flp pilus assembly protein CpaB
MTYDTRTNIWLIFVALVFAALAAWLATRWMQTRIDLADNGKLRLSNMVIAARDVPLGKRIEAADEHPAGRLQKTGGRHWKGLQVLGVGG